MKVLMLNGSCNLKGCTFTALSEIAKTLSSQGIESEIFQLGAQPIRDCIGCGKCRETGTGCIFKENKLEEFHQKAAEADGFIFGTPVYYAHPSGRVLSFLDRAFFSATEGTFRFKPGAAIASARRAGTTATLDALNKYFGIAMMPVVSSSYWNMVHGNTPEQVMQDAEGLQVMRHLALNMAWMLKNIEAGKAAGVALPPLEAPIRTNFIR